MDNPEKKSLWDKAVDEYPFLTVVGGTISTTAMLALPLSSIGLKNTADLCLKEDKGAACETAIIFRRASQIIPLLGKDIHPDISEKELKEKLKALKEREVLNIRV